MKMNNRWMILAAFAFIALLPAKAQDRQDTAWVFRIVPGNDMFFNPYGDNGEELARLFECVTANMTRIRNGETPIYVDSYCNSGTTGRESLSIAKTRANRVKSELIVRNGLDEGCFVTRNHATEGEVVTVRIAMPKVEKLHESHTQREEKSVVVENRRKDTAPKTETETAETVTSVAEETLTRESSACNGTYHLAMRANLLRWATLTPDLGIEWRVNRHVGIAVSGSWTSWSWDNKNRRYALWEVAPEVRYYIGKTKRGYLGAQYKAGGFNYKFGKTGRQGDLMGGGLVGGYLLRLNNAFSLDFALGVGYLRADYDRYVVIDGVRVNRGKAGKNWWGPTHAGVTLVWNIF